MKTVRLGKTGLEVTRVGIGGIPIQRPPEDAAIKVIQRALDLGVTFIDTARGYGDSEKRIGKAIADRREEVIIATKGTWQSKEAALEQIDLSLKHLNTDYIDLWQFHNPSTFERLDLILKPGGALEGAKEALEKGKIRHIDMSIHTLDVALKAVTTSHFETVQVPFNFVTIEPANELVSLAKKHNVGFIAMKPFAGGLLDDANLTIKYLLQFDNVVPIPGIEKTKEIEEIVNIVNGSWELTSQEQTKMEKFRSELGTQFCRRCGYCMPCPEGVRIEQLVCMPILWKLWPSKETLSDESIGGFMKASVESAENCIQCGECEEKCPYHLPIREMITKSINLYEKMKKQKKVSATGN